MTAPIDPVAPAGDAVAPEGGRPDVSSGVKAGLRWSLFSQLGVRFVSVISGIFLFRLLDAENYGVYAFALAVINILISFNDLGQVLTIVRWTGDDVLRAARTATTIVWCTTAVCFLACFAGAGWLAHLSGNEAAAGPLRLMAFMLLIDGVSTTPRALLFRAFKHSRSSIADLAGLPVNVGLSLALAAAGAGAWAPAVGTVAAAVITGGIVFFSAPKRPRPGWDRGHARRLLAFGFPLAVTTLVELTLLNVDYLIIGNRLGAVALGYYALAFNVSSWPSTLVTQAIRKVSVAGFSQLSGDRAHLTAMFGRSMTMLLTLLLLVCTGIAVLASPLVRILYGADSTAAGHVLSWLIVLGAVRVTVGLMFDLLLSLGRSRTTLRLQVLWLIAVIPSLWIGAATGGIVGVAVAHTIIAVFWALPLHLSAIKGVGIRLGALGRPLVRPLIGAGVAGAVGTAAMLGLRPDLVDIAVAGPLVLVVYVIIGVPRAELGRIRRMAR